MSAYLIDTDWVIDVLHGNAAATEALLDLAPQGLALSLITYGELYEGAHFARTGTMRWPGSTPFSVARICCH